MTTKSDFAARYPGVFYLDAGAVDEIAAYLHRPGLARRRRARAGSGEGR